MHDGLLARAALEGEDAGPLSVSDLLCRVRGLLPVMRERREIFRAARVFRLDRLGHLAVELAPQRRPEVLEQLLAELIVSEPPLLIADLQDAGFRAAHEPVVMRDLGMDRPYQLRIDRTAADGGRAQDRECVQRHAVETPADDFPDSTRDHALRQP